MDKLKTDETPHVSSNPQRRRFLAASAASAAGIGGFFGPWAHNRVWAQSAQAKPLVIGLTMDASGQYAASGGMERLGAMMAIREFNDKGGLLGRPIEAIHMDTETTPATGSRVAERMINRNDAAFLIGAVHSGVANAISQVAQKYGCIFLNTNSSSPTESGKDCHRVKFVWDGNGTNFAQATVRNAIRTGGKDWVLMTNDYVWGHNTSKATRTLIEANGGRVIEELLIPQNTRDFSSYLLKLQQLKPQVVATAVGGDDIKALRQQVVQLGLQKRAAWINNQQDWPDVYGLGPESIFGVFGTTWYYRLDLPGVKEFVAAYQKQFPGMAIAVPGNVFYNGYMATRELLRCVQEAGTTQNISVIKKLEGRKMSARDRMQHYDAWIDPVTHQVQQTIYLASYNDTPAEKNDIYKILTQSEPKDVIDPAAVGSCKLESYEATPSYER
ncbi:ABC transporter substrate-binding protein [Hylemonella gracilis str. Niagara R]|uniref:ABC transporter substrate-binding protein n=1 Tax=Hylemonella gracilis str. Niagara R TaxID=1458275 RepID=A0A016XI99_9BURK|nr:ABC transporter substrate-binding protein [Hylemonella gracilis]EYC51297.1 ABC transporter substrate-binding protein [Hylemonella gracilis str. Niagara R]